MRITARQAASILNMSVGQVALRIRRGELKDYGVRTPGATRHHFILDDQEVRTYKRLQRAGVTPLELPNTSFVAATQPAPEAPPVSTPTAMSAPVEAVPASPAPSVSERPTPTASLSRMASELATMNDRLAALEQKFDTLLAVWS